MSMEEFVKIYVDANDNAKALFEETLRSYQIQPASPGEESHKYGTVRLLFSSAPDHSASKKDASEHHIP